MTEKCSVIYMYHIVSVQSWFDGHLGWSHIIAIESWTAINMGTKITVSYADFISFRKILRYRMVVGSYGGGSILKYLRNLYTIFHNEYSSLHSHWYIFFCTSLAIITGVRSLIVIFNCIYLMTSNLEYLFMCHLVFCFVLWKMSVNIIDSFLDCFIVDFIELLIYFGY